MGRFSFKSINKSIKKYPYFYVLALSCACAYLYAGYLKFQERTAQPMTEIPAADTCVADSLENIPAKNSPTADADAPSDAISAKVPPADAGVQKIIGITEFEYYDAKQVSSPYYSDPGKIALTTAYPYKTVGDDYFADAAFIGDSRTLGLFDYSGLADTDFYCDNGFCTYLWSKGKEVIHQNTGEKVILDEAMDAKNYAKIYVMLGLNDCGYGNIGHFRKRYGDMLDMLHSKQPDAVIYLLANLHLSQAKSDSDDIYNNDDINAHNVAIAELADGETFFYLDINSLFTDEQRNLKAELTFDGAHLYADGYMDWMVFLKEHAVAVPPGNAEQS